MKNEPIICLTPDFAQILFITYFDITRVACSIAFYFRKCRIFPNNFVLWAIKTTIFVKTISFFYQSVMRKYKICLDMSSEFESM